VKVLHLLAVVLLITFSFSLTGCPGGPGGTPSSQTATEDPAIKEAKSKEDGSSLKPGESKEVQTNNGMVVVSKDSAGKVTYKVK
jgi:hypothetical protein